MDVGSAGFTGDGQAPPTEVIEVMADRDFDLSGHRSRQVTPTIIAETGLVLTMTREQLIDVVVLSPQHWSHCFTLVDAVRRAENVERRATGMLVGTWAQRLAGGRSRASLLSLPLADDIPDPMGRRRSAFVSTAGQLDDLVSRLVARLRPV